MADIKVRVGQTPAIKVTSALGGTQAGSLSDLSDVNIDEEQNSMLFFRPLSAQ